MKQHRQWRFDRVTELPQKMTLLPKRHRGSEHSENGLNLSSIAPAASPFPDELIVLFRPLKYISKTWLKRLMGKYSNGLFKRNMTLWIKFLVILPSLKVRISVSWWTSACTQNKYRILSFSNLDREEPLLKFGYLLIRSTCYLYYCSTNTKPKSYSR